MTQDLFRQAVTDQRAEPGELFGVAEVTNAFSGADLLVGVRELGFEAALVKRDADLASREFARAVDAIQPRLSRNRSRVAALLGEEFRVGRIVHVEAAELHHLTGRRLESDDAGANRVAYGRDGRDHSARDGFPTGRGHIGNRENGVAIHGWGGSVRRDGRGRRRAGRTLFGRFGRRGRRGGRGGRGGAAALA